MGQWDNLLETVAKSCGKRIPIVLHFRSMGQFTPNGASMFPTNPDLADILGRMKFDCDLEDEKQMLDRGQLFP